MAVGLLLVVSPVSASPGDEVVVQRAQALLDRMAKVDGPGVVVLIARGDKVVFLRARGLADIELRVPLTPQHAFRIASITKTFTAALVLKLAEDRRISLDDRLSAHLPEMGEAGEATIRHLLNHTAGISDRSSSSRTDRGGRILEIGNRSLNFRPGSSWAYSNSAYILLGAVIEKITGEPWYVAMRKQLLAPQGLVHTQYGDLSVLITGRAKGYTTVSPNLIRNADHVPAAVPDAAGALISTANDLLLWFRALSSGRAISRRAFEEMIEPSPASVDDPYGLGVYIGTVRSETTIGHTGQIPGFASVALYLPRRDVTIVALGNDDSFDARQAGRRLAAIAIGLPYRDPAAIQPSASELQSLEGTYGSGDAQRTLSLTNGVFHAKRRSGTSIPLQMTADRSLHYAPDLLSYFVPVRDESGQVTRLDYYRDGEGPPRQLWRVR